MNSNLYGSQFTIPEDIRQHLVDMYQKHGYYGQGGDGYERNRQLQSAPSLSYQQAKRIKNFFDTYKGDQNHPEFNLNGGTKMKQFVESILSGARRGLDMTDRNKRETGMQMDRNYNHSQPNMNISPSQSHKKTVEKNMNEQALESLKWINKIMNEESWQH
jgi:hypothetical protein